MSLAGYTRFVALSKHSLWILVAVIVALVIWIAEDNNGESGARLVFSNVPKTVAMQNIMANPNYQGMDARNNPYTILADKATQLDTDNVALVNVRADMRLADGTWVALNSGTGHLNLKTKQLELHDGVNVFYEGGYEFRSDQAHVDIQEGSAYGNSPVEGQGPAGTLNSNSFSVQNHGQSVRFNGSVRMTLYR